MNYYLGIDNGGTLSKAALFDNTGNEIAVSALDTPLVSPTERDMEMLWEYNARAIADCIQKLGVAPADIKGVALTGHGKGLYLWGKDGKPAYHGIVSTDQRAQPLVDEWYKNGVADQIYPKTCQRLLACQPAALLKWMKLNRREVYDNIQTVFEVKDYIRFMLTGEAYAEITDYSGTSLMNLAEKRFDPAIFELLGIEEMLSCMPPIISSFDCCGKVTDKAESLTGLKAGTPVFGGMFDIDACALAMNVTETEDLCTITGTWSINEYIAKAPVMSGVIAMNSLFCLDDYYLVEECSPTSCSNLEWFKNTFLTPDISYKTLDEWVENTPANPDGAIFLPFVFTTGGKLSGLSAGHSTAQLVRAVFEGVAFSCRRHIETLLKTREHPAKIKLAGGAANSCVWVQMFADVLGFPIEVMETKELGTLGCAITAACGAGEYTSLTEAAARMTRAKALIQPNPALKAVYDQLYARFIRECSV